MSQDVQSQTDVTHCRDCCCARSWKALGITEYTGKSIPEHITELKEELDRLRTANAIWEQTNVR